MILLWGQLMLKQQIQNWYKFWQKYNNYYSDHNIIQHQLIRMLYYHDIISMSLSLIQPEITELHLKNT